MCGARFFACKGGWGEQLHTHNATRGQQLNTHNVTTVLEVDDVVLDQVDDVVLDLYEPGPVAPWPGRLCMTRPTDDRRTGLTDQTDC